MSYLDEMYLKYMLKIKNCEGIGTVEMVLILVILVALVLVFKSSITNIVNKALSAATSKSSQVYN